MSSAGAARRPVKVQEFVTAIKDMSDFDLIKLNSEIENGVRHLDASNRRLNVYLQKLKGQSISEEDETLMDEVQNIDQDDIEIFESSLKENLIVMRNYEDRLDAIVQEQTHRSAGVKKVPQNMASSNSANLKSVDDILDMDNTTSDTVAVNSGYH